MGIKNTLELKKKKKEMATKLKEIQKEASLISLSVDSILSCLDKAKTENDIMKICDKYDIFQELKYLELI